MRKLSEMGSPKAAVDLIPWKVTDLPLRPYDDLWSFNPSVHFDGSTWRCLLRCCDYAMPEGRTIRSKGARPLGQQTKNAMVVLDPKSWRPVQVFKMSEKDGLPRATTPHLGFEDTRLFRTERDGLQGIAASLHLQRARSVEGMRQHQPPEQVVLSFDDAYNVVAARPIRGEAWSGTPQKNWVPFDGATEPRFLFSIERGLLFDDQGPLEGDHAVVRSGRACTSTDTAPVTVSPTTPAPPAAPSPVERSRRPSPVRGSDMRVVRGGRVVLDTMATRPSSRPRRPATHASAHGSRTARTARGNEASTRIVGSGRASLPKYQGLRGGTQLLRVADDLWLGVAHQMEWVSNKKFYFHTWYAVDSRGHLRSASEPMKLAPQWIEFAAGMGIDGDQVVISFGVDDMECRIAETRLSAVMEVLRPVERVA